MGRDKRLLAIGADTLYGRSLAALRSVFHRVLVVVAQDSAAIAADATVVRDLFPDCGSLGGLYTGLKQADTDWVFVVACDMPFLDPEMIKRFLELKGDADVTMAKLDRGLQPMHAVYHRNCLPIMERLLDARELKIQRLADDPALRVRLVLPQELPLLDADARSFYNINTPDDLEAARALHNKDVKPSV
jgi:molybdopterin-guanine dinucleotide biosynthesis protein A